MKLAIATSVLLTLILSTVPAPPATANPIWPGIFELVDRPYGTSIPPDGSQWHAISMREGPDGFEPTVAQTLYSDNGDGIVSIGDAIHGPESAWRERVAVVGTCRLYRLVETGWIVRTLPGYSGTPVGEIWAILKPTEFWGEPREVQAFTQAAPAPMALPVAGDQVLLDGVWATIEWARLGVDGDFAVPVERTTWGRIKAMLEGGR
jgi:hypothetical protein